MNIVELYQQTPVEEHKNIRMRNEAVLVISPEGTDEYLVDEEGELTLVKSDKDLRAHLKAVETDLSAIKTKLGITGA